MSVMMLRATVKDESVADVESAVTTMFSAIREGRPAGVRYASCRVADSATFVVLLQLDEGTDNPLAAIPAFREFQDSLRHWIAEPPVTEQLSVVGSYGLF